MEGSDGVSGFGFLLAASWVSAASWKNTEAKSKQTRNTKNNTIANPRGILHKEHGVCNLVFLLDVFVNFGFCPTPPQSMCKQVRSPGRSLTLGDCRIGAVALVCSWTPHVKSRLGGESSCSALGFATLPKATEQNSMIPVPYGT